MLQNLCPSARLSRLSCLSTALCSPRCRFSDPLFLLHGGVSRGRPSPRKTEKKRNRRRTRQQWSFCRLPFSLRASGPPQLTAACAVWPGLVVCCACGRRCQKDRNPNNLAGQSAACCCFRDFTSCACMHVRSIACMEVRMASPSSSGLDLGPRSSLPLDCPHRQPCARIKESHLLHSTRTSTDCSYRYPFSLCRRC